MFFQGFYNQIMNRIRMSTPSAKISNGDIKLIIFVHFVIDNLHDLNIVYTLLSSHFIIGLAD
ncbi:Uncharacterised protein [Mycobacterium tuberculosis]|nr:Uncharacterised protein [Mycobacterium tuberculosis]